METVSKEKMKLEWRTDLKTMQRLTADWFSTEATLIDCDCGEDDSSLCKLK
jgi:hypothetical protein